MSENKSCAIISYMTSTTVLYILFGLACLILLPVVLRIVFYILVWLVLIVISLFYSPKKEYEKPSRASHKILVFGYKVICSMGRVKIHFKGTEKLPEGKRFLFVSNHRSKFDNMVQTIAMKDENLAFVSKSANFKIPIGRRFINRNCYINLQRRQAKSAFEMVMKAQQFISNGITSIGIFPEGTRSKTSELLPFKPGVFKIAQKANCPVVVGVIKNTEKIHKNWPVHRTHVYFEIIKVYKQEEVSSRNTSNLASEIEGLVRAELEKPFFADGTK